MGLIDVGREVVRGNLGRILCLISLRRNEGKGVILVYQNVIVTCQIMFCTVEN